MSEPWRQRLREAIERSGRKHSVVAMDAGITPETLSRILNAMHVRPSLETITRIAHAVNESVGWILEEEGFSLSGAETRQLAAAVRFLGESLLKTTSFRRKARYRRLRHLSLVLQRPEKAGETP
jgi:transcriptional regulator with XRE-family HTH domain